MQSVFFLVIVGVFTALYLNWGFKHLTKENMQIFGAMPRTKQPEGFWKGVNFTWYGLLCANAVLCSSALYLVLSGSSGVPAVYSLGLMAILFSILLPSARWIARLVEKKNHTFTVGGSVFAGIIVSPVVIGLLNAVLSRVNGFRFPVIETLSSLAVSYAFGESLGRLSCISFGCCYGKPLSTAHPFLQKLFKRRHFVFTEHTRKACYASGLDGVETLPIQAVTSVICAVSAMIGMTLFLFGYPASALLETLLATQIWRVLSEFFRDDYRGEGLLSAYQIMGLIASIAAVFMVFLFSGHSVEYGHIEQGISEIWNPSILLSLQALWVLTLVYMGKSTVTYAHLTFHVDRQRI